jgi:hypothetical protein
VLWRSPDKNYKNPEMNRNALQELGEKYLRDWKYILNKVECLWSYFQ